ncbi:hypothetical protein V6N11_048332 [Hibiscus sabdariffa]|uniref:Uncharacterized protein n=1 Tax=Hibiscus sabdariffa TaxID=183260 RepID=A0ABR2PUZ5_9ROSI
MEESSSYVGPAAVAIGGKIYVFGSTPSTGGCFVEVFNIHGNRWDILLPPPVSSFDLLCLSDPVLFDFSRSRILVHFGSNNSLYAFSPTPDGGSWECLDTEFWSWANASVIVDDIAYFLFDPISDWVLVTFLELRQDRSYVEGKMTYGSTTRNNDLKCETRLRAAVDFVRKVNRRKEKEIEERKKKREVKSDRREKKEIERKKMREVRRRREEKEIEGRKKKRKVMRRRRKEEEIERRKMKREVRKRRREKKETEKKKMKRKMRSKEKEVEERKKKRHK